MSLTMKSLRCCALAWLAGMPMAHAAENFCINYQGTTGEPMALGVRDWSGGSLVAERVASVSTEWPPAPVALGARKWEPIYMVATTAADVQSLAQGLHETTAHPSHFAAPSGYLELVSLGPKGLPVHATRFTNPVVVGVGVPSLPDRAPKFEFELMPDQQLTVVAKCVTSGRETAGAGHPMVGGDVVTLSADGLASISALRMAGFKYGVNLAGESGGLRSGQMRISPKARPETVKFTLAAGTHASWFQWFQDVVVQFRDVRKKIQVTLVDAAGRPALHVTLLDALPLRWSPIVSDAEPSERYVLEVAPTQIEISLPK
ncbi:hypothetical protein [Leptothrix ochracea]|uniref:hypothetical protein n=1 Tax=Leptothrix ochracea TaxID=735331 RepID=UPI0034E268A2